MFENCLKRTINLLCLASKRCQLTHSTRTALAAMVSYAFASLFKMPEAYWASITTLVIMQSSLGAAWTVSKRRLIGTAMGAALGALLASYFAPGMIVYGGAILTLGVICGLLRLDQGAYRFAGIALTIVMLIARTQSVWITGIHRFVEVSLGIIVGLIFSITWPRRMWQRDKNASENSF